MLSHHNHQSHRDDDGEEVRSTLGDVREDIRFGQPRDSREHRRWNPHGFEDRIVRP